VRNIFVYPSILLSLLSYSAHAMDISKEIQEALQNKSYQKIHKLLDSIPANSKQLINYNLLNATEIPASLVALENHELMSEVCSFLIGNKYDNPEAHHALIHKSSFKINLARIRALYTLTDENHTLTGKFFAFEKNNDHQLTNKQIRLIKKSWNNHMHKEIPLSFFEKFTARSLPDEIKNWNKICNKTYFVDKPLRRLGVTLLINAPLTLSISLLVKMNKLNSAKAGVALLLTHLAAYTTCHRQNQNSNNLCALVTYFMPESLILASCLYVLTRTRHAALNINLLEKDYSDSEKFFLFAFCPRLIQHLWFLRQQASQWCKNNIGQAIYSQLPAPQRGLREI